VDVTYSKGLTQKQQEKSSLTTVLVGGINTQEDDFIVIDGNEPTELYIFFNE
jgi:hypothetical protein